MQERTGGCSLHKFALGGNNRYDRSPATDPEQPRGASNFQMIRPDFDKQGHSGIRAQFRIARHRKFRWIADFERSGLELVCRCRPRLNGTAHEHWSESSEPVREARSWVDTKLLSRLTASRRLTRSTQQWQQTKKTLSLASRQHESQKRSLGFPQF